MKFRKTTIIALFALALLAACATASAPEKDAWIQDQISAKIANDVSLEGLDIAIDVENGQVLLTGTVAEKAQRTKVIAHAGSVPGVTSVLDRLELAS